jgi:hypothetical protein
VRFRESGTGIFPGISEKQKVAKMKPKLPVLPSKVMMKHQNSSSIYVVLITKILQLIFWKKNF